ncbi:BCCT family transporter [Alkalihalobacillus pseudalcaliphilus]|uniref:BCCT family transporter n=1 Tax=Alkalihalobacillus pseudalcaliphilus TaxID=79884 RepID=UPI00064E0903|nr:BCCT family transporter [Alkalihalobacillus pseudalcaliphilus]KMK77704.1 glycine/betaine ABC transporter permease [Alkalihalobacillus pseudalcaliphilus]
MKTSKSSLSIVFWVSLGIASIFILWGILFPSNVESVLGTIDSFLASYFGWVYIIATTLFVLLAIFLIVGPFGRIRLGRPDEKPEYSYFTWFAFLFTAGMGVGLVFFGVSEPLTHYHNPPSANPMSMAAAEESLRYTLFHWGFHPWATYAIVALTLAYFKFRHHAPALISSALTPILGKRTNGTLGFSVDILAVFVTIFGIATSLGLGASQITAGLSYTYNGFENNTTMTMIVIAIVTVLFILSAMSGLDKGIRYLSWANIIIAVALMLFVFALSSPVRIFEGFTTTVGNYLQNLPSMTLGMNTFTGEREFLNDWTLFYWSWWIGWSTFVGTFIARVSRGRTIREFVLGVMAVPVVFSALWFAIFGIAGIDLDNAYSGALYQIILDQGNEVALFAFLEQYPFSPLILGIAILLISSFFITSADSATFVLGMLTTGGRLNPQVKVKVIWGLILSGTASVLLLSGGLQALEMAMLIAAFPFTFVVILMMVSLLKALSSEYDILRLELKHKEWGKPYQEESKEELKVMKEEFESTMPEEIVDEAMKDQTNHER